MNIINQTWPSGSIVYPDSDGEPIAENTLQFRWIVTLEGGYDALFADRPDVFVAGDLLWYPVEGEPKIRQAPDVLVVFGRPKGYRGSYRQWEEGGIPLHVVFEVLSPGNRAGELIRKFEFYDRYGVEEYYTYDPDDGKLEGWRRDGERLIPIEKMEGWVSPRLGTRFELVDGELQVVRPDGRRFATYVELEQQRTEAERSRAEAERSRADAERSRADAERSRAEAEHGRTEAERRWAEAEHSRAEAERSRIQTEREKEQVERDKALAQQQADALRAQLRAAGIEPQS